MTSSFGLHIGNTSACLAVNRVGRVEVVANDAGDRVTPCAVGFSIVEGSSQNEILTGLSAKQHAHRNPRSVVLSDNVSKLTNSETCNMCYELNLQSRSSSGDLINRNIRTIPSEIFFHTVKTMFEIASSHATAGDEKLSVVLSYENIDVVDPANVKRLVGIVQKVGFNVLQVISCDAAACLAYNLPSRSNNIGASEEQKILSVRIGGSTCSASLLQMMGEGEQKMVKILKTCKGCVAGNSITSEIADQLALEFIRKFKGDPRETKKGQAKLNIEAEKVKHILTKMESAHAYIESLHDGIDFSFNMTRTKFEQLCLAKVLPEMLKPIHDLQLTKGDISPHILVYGGSCKIPKVQQSITSLFTSNSAEVLLSDEASAGLASCDEVISRGCAIQAGHILSNINNSNNSSHHKLNFNVNQGDVRYKIKSEMPILSGGWIGYSFHSEEEEEEEVSKITTSVDKLSVLVDVGHALPFRKHVHLTCPSSTPSFITVHFVDVTSDSPQISKISVNRLDETTIKMKDSDDDKTSKFSLIVGVKEDCSVLVKVHPFKPHHNH